MKTHNSLSMNCLITQVIIWVVKKNQQLIANKMSIQSLPQTNRNDSQLISFNRFLNFETSCVNVEKMLFLLILNKLVAWYSFKPNFIWCYRLLILISMFINNVIKACFKSKHLIFVTKLCHNTIVRLHAWI